MHARPRLASRYVPAAAAVVAATIVLLGSSTGGCQTATQVTVELRTIGALPCTSLKGVAIAVARTPSEAEERMRIESFSAQVSRGECGADGKTIGTLVITPSDAAGAIVVRARVSEAADATCAPPDYKGCIVARRSFSFIEHAALTLPITLEVACVDVPCDVVSSCRSGVCVSSEASCSESSGACSSIAEPVPAGDGGTIPPDEAGIVAPNDGSVPPDGSVVQDSSLPSDSSPPTDAPADAYDGSPPQDSGTDAPSSTPGLCPTSAANVDCYFANAGTTPICCLDMQNGYMCTSAGGCAGLYPHYYCTGPTHCAPGARCCGGVPDAGGGYVAMCGGAGSGCGGQDIICGSNADCPLDKPSCTKISSSRNGKTIYACE